MASHRSMGEEKGKGYFFVKNAVGQPASLASRNLRGLIKKAVFVLVISMLRQFQTFNRCAPFKSFNRCASFKGSRNLSGRGELTRFENSQNVKRFSHRTVVAAGLPPAGDTLRS